MGKGVSVEGGLVSEWRRHALECHRRGCRVSGRESLRGPLRGAGTMLGVTMLSQ